MKIKKFLEQMDNAGFDNIKESGSRTGRTMKDAMIANTSIWSNKSCNGYCIMAMEKAGFNSTDISRMLDALKVCYDSVSPEAAEKKAMTWK